MSSQFLVNQNWREISEFIYEEAELDYDLLEVESHKTVFYHKSAKTGQLFKKITRKDHATKYFVADPAPMAEVSEQISLAI